MRDLCAGWVPPSEAELKRYWEDGILAVDSSVLLGLYRVPPIFRDDLVSALEAFADRLWIPHQVAVDYHHNRLRVLLQQRGALEKLRSALDAAKEHAQTDVRALLQGISRRELQPIEEAFAEGFAPLAKSVLAVEEAHRERLGQSLRDDPVLEIVDRLCAGKVGPPLSEDDLKAVQDDARRRIENEIPPGYEDAEKSDPEKFGDMVIWEQLCGKGKESDRPILFVTDDQKADWVWREAGQTIGPRPELVAEMKDVGGVGFHIYGSSQFVSVSKGESTPEVVSADEPESGAKELSPVLLDALLATFRESERELHKERSAPAKRASDKRRAVKKVPPPVATHEFTENGVVLMLNRPPRTDGVEVRCAVIDPNGHPTVVQVLVPGPNEGLPLGLHRIAFDYPDQFPSSGTLTPGLYQVIWYRVNPGWTRVNGTTEREIARDSFVVVGDDDEVEIHPSES